MPPTDAAQIALERAVDSLEKLLAVWTLLVAVGLMMEYGAELAKLFSERHTPIEGLGIPQNRRIKDRFVWIRVFIVIGALFVTVGVGGELYIEAQLSLAEARLRRYDDDELASDWLRSSWKQPR